MKPNQTVFQQIASFPNAVHEKGATIALSSMATEYQRRKWIKKYKQYPDVFTALKVKDVMQ